MKKTQYHTADVPSRTHRLDQLFEVNTKTKNKMTFNEYVLFVRPNLQRQTSDISSRHHVIFYILMSPTETHPQQTINNNSHY